MAKTPHDFGDVAALVKPLGHCAFSSPFFVFCCVFVPSPCSVQAASSLSGRRRPPRGAGQRPYSRRIPPVWRGLLQDHNSTFATVTATTATRSEAKLHLNLRLLCTPFKAVTIAEFGCVSPKSPWTSVSWKNNSSSRVVLSFYS